MRFTYAGCNLFGQMVESQAVAITRFSEHSFPPDVLDLCIGHSIIVFMRADSLLFHGHGLKPRQTHQVIRVEIPGGAKPAKVCSADTSIFLLTDKGGLFVLDFLSHLPTFEPRPLKLEAIGSGDVTLKDKVVNFVAGTAINIGLTANGMLYSFPNRLQLTLPEGDSIQNIAAGYEHCLILDSAGNVYSFGNGRRGQLGHGDLENVETPSPVETLTGILIVAIACGGWHSMALSDNGDVYVWGWNCDGQLGLFDENNEPFVVVPRPHYLSLENDLTVTHIGAGGRHSICITKNRNVYAFGCNKFNQLGIEDHELVVNEPTKVYELEEDRRILKIVCGPTATAILTE